jgi:hypothetical protein
LVEASGVSATVGLLTAVRPPRVFGGSIGGGAGLAAWADSASCGAGFVVAAAAIDGPKIDGSGLDVVAATSGRVALLSVGEAALEVWLGGAQEGV